MDEFEFHLRCKCGYEINGFFGEDDEVDILHCECGLEWEIKRPHAIDKTPMITRCEHGNMLVCDECAKRHRPTEQPSEAVAE